MPSRVWSSDSLPSIRDLAWFVVGVAGAVAGRLPPAGYVHDVHDPGHRMVAASGRRTVVGMLAGARMAQAVSFHAACRFFSHAKWEVDQLGLGVLRLVLQLLPGAQQVSTGPDGIPVCSITVNIDDTLFRRWGRKVHAVFWTHDGAAQGKHKIGRGNRWVVAGIVVRLPFCSSP